MSEKSKKLLFLARLLGALFSDFRDCGIMQKAMKKPQEAPTSRG